MLSTITTLLSYFLHVVKLLWDTLRAFLHLGVLHKLEVPDLAITREKQLLVVASNRSSEWNFQGNSLAAIHQIHSFFDTFGKPESYFTPNNGFHWWQWKAGSSAKQNRTSRIAFYVRPLVQCFASIGDSSLRDLRFIAAGICVSQLTRILRAADGKTRNTGARSVLNCAFCIPHLCTSNIIRLFRRLCRLALHTLLQRRRALDDNSCQSTNVAHSDPYRFHLRILYFG